MPEQPADQAVQDDEQRDAGRHDREHRLVPQGLEDDPLQRQPEQEGTHDHNGEGHPP
ncbi:hypothetical protein D9M68_981600 [compost metagenome]|jgi:hypothetical protein